MTAKNLHRLNDALDASASRALKDERIEREARHYISKGQIERRDGEIFFEGNRLLSRFQAIFHRLLDEEEANERWEKGMEKI